jgi:hypothetical protein
VEAPASKAATASATLGKGGTGGAASEKVGAPAAPRSEDWRRLMTPVGISIGGGRRGRERLGIQISPGPGCVACWCSTALLVLRPVERDKVSRMLMLLGATVQWLKDLVGFGVLCSMRFSIYISNFKFNDPALPQLFCSL